MEAFLDFIKDHWFFAILMFIMSLVAATLVIWRLMLNFSAGTDLNAFLPRFQEVLNKDGVEGATKFCRAQPGMIPRRLFVAGLESQKQGLAAIRRAMANVIDLEIIPDLNYLLPSILAIAKIATMVGLLGTVISMIYTFQELGKAAKRAQTTGIEAEASSSERGEEPQARASREIGLALFATALGLMTAIPLVFSHVLFKAWVHKFEIKMRRAAQKLLVLVQAMKPAAAAATAPRTAAARPAPTVSNPRAAEDELRHG